MKSKVLKIQFESASDFEKRTYDALAAKKKSVRRTDTILFSSVVAYQKFMTEQKYVILATIYKHKPNSVYQLAKLLDRDLANVKRDCDSLNAGGFIVLEPAQDNKKTRAPRLAFAYEAIVVYMPNITYSHLLSETAA